jgi:hypothetical protein
MVIIINQVLFLIPVDLLLTTLKPTFSDYPWGAAPPQKSPLSLKMRGGSSGGGSPWAAFFIFFKKIKKKRLLEAPRFLSDKNN